MAKKELVKLGFEAIEYAIRKFLTKKPEGLASIPGQNMKARIKVLVDKYATMFRMKGQNVNTVTVKQVENEIDYGVSLQKQRAKEEGLKRFPKETHKFFGRPLKEQDFKEIDKLYPPKKTPTTESLLKGEKYTDERGRTWDFGTKDRPFPGFKPKIVPKEPDYASGGIAGELHLNEGGRVPMLLGGNPIKWGKGIFNYLRKIAAERAAKKKFMADLDKMLFDEKGNLKEGAVEKHFQDMTGDFNRQIEIRKDFLKVTPPKDRKLNAQGGLARILDI